jgi:hypothetical protein
LGKSPGLFRALVDCLEKIRDLFQIVGSPAKRLKQGITLFALANPRMCLIDTQQADLLSVLNRVLSDEEWATPQKRRLDES